MPVATHLVKCVKEVRSIALPVRMDSYGTTTPASPLLSSNFHSSCSNVAHYLTGLFVSSSRIIEIPLVEFVKESEGRGTRAKDNVEPGRFLSASHWLFGMAASFIAGIIVVLAVQVLFFFVFF